MSNKFITTVQQYGDTEDFFIEIPDEICKELGWKEGDIIDWKTDDKGIILTNTSSTKEEPTMSDYDWYESESEGKDFDQKYDNYIENTAKETFGQYYHSPEAQGGWFAIKAEAIQKYAT